MEKYKGGVYGQIGSAADDSDSSEQLCHQGGVLSTAGWHCCNTAPTGQMQLQNIIFSNSTIQFVTDVQPALISNTNFYCEEVKNKISSNDQKRRPTADVEDRTYSEQQDFILSLLTCDSKAVGLSLFPETCLNFKAKSV